MSVWGTITRFVDDLISTLHNDDFVPLNRGTAAVIGLLYLKHGIPSDTTLPKSISFQDALDNATGFGGEPMPALLWSTSGDLEALATEALGSCDRRSGDYTFNVNVWQLLASAFHREQGLTLPQALANLIGAGGWQWETVHGQPKAYGLFMSPEAGARLAEAAYKILSQEVTVVPTNLDFTTEIMIPFGKQYEHYTLMGLNHGWGVTTDGTYITMSNTGLKIACASGRYTAWVEGQ